LGHGAVVDGIEVAAGRQHVEAPARGGAGWPGGDEPAVEAGKEGGDLVGAGGGEAGADGVGDGVEDGACGVPVGLRGAGAVDELCGEGFELFDDVADGAALSLPSPLRGGVGGG